MIEILAWPNRVTPPSEGQDFLAMDSRALFCPDYEAQSAKHVYVPGYCGGIPLLNGNDRRHSAAV